MLSLGRLNLICRCLKSRLIKGYRPLLSVNFAEFLQHNFSYLLTEFLYMTMVLSAMEVGLATKQLQNQEILLQNATGFAIFSIVLPFYVLSGIMLASIGYGMRMLWGACSTKNKLPKSIAPSPAESSHSESFRSSSSGQRYQVILSFFGRDKNSPKRRKCIVEHSLNFFSKIFDQKTSWKIFF